MSIYIRQRMRNMQDDVSTHQGTSEKIEIPPDSSPVASAIQLQDEEHDHPSKNTQLKYCS